MWFGRSSFGADTFIWGHVLMRRARRYESRRRRNQFEDQGPAAYGRLCPTVLGSVPPRVRPPNNSRTPSRALRHTLTPLQECGSVQTWFYLVT